MRICIFSRSFYPALGGLERIGFLLATEFRRMGHEVIVLTDTEAPAETDESLPFAVVRSRSKWKRIQTFGNSDAVLFMNISLPGLIAAAASKRPVLLSHHGIYRGEGLRSIFVEPLKKQLTRLYPNIAVSSYVGRHIPGDCVVIPNAYDDELFVRDSAAPKHDFVFCGRLVSEKGADLCVRALAELVPTNPSVRLSIVGNGPEEIALRKLVSDLRLTENVSFLGPMHGNDVVTTLQSHYCMIVPSTGEEGFGIVALEGLACCDYVIASSRGGLPEAIGSHGILTEPTVKSLARAMKDVIDARSRSAVPPDLSGRFQHLKRHSRAIVAEAYIEELRRSAHRSRRRFGQ